MSGPVSSLPPSLSDEQLRAAVFFSFAADESLINADVRVGVLNGIVHLTGRVASLKIRDKAQKIAERIHGVRGVVNRIEAPGAPSPARSIHLDLPP
jgi:osmotically-inducible protein OsmY